MSDPFRERLEQEAPSPKPDKSPFDERLGELAPARAQPSAPERDFGAPNKAFRFNTPGEPSLTDRAVGTLRNMRDRAAQAGRGVSEAVGGFERQTRATRALPELSEVGVNRILGDDVSGARKAAVSAALATTFDAEEAVQILRAANPDLGVSFDEKGNVMVTNNEAGITAVMNRPGVSPRDVLTGASVGAAFTPAARGGSAIGVGLRSGGTQAAIEAGQAASGGEFDAGEVAIAGGGGALFQGLFNRMAQAFPVLRQGAPRITDEIRQAFRQEASRVGIDPSQITDEVIRRAATQSRSAASPETVNAAALEQEFRIPFSEGQRSLDPSQVEFEDLARTGTLGEDARAPLLDLQQTQRQRAQEVRGEIGEQLGPVEPRNTRETGEFVAQGVRGQEETLNAAVNEAYSDVGDAALTPEGFRNLLVSSRKALIGPQFDRSLPETEKMLSRISNILRIETGLESAGARRAKVPINQIDGLRQRLNGSIESAEGRDRSQLIAIKRAFDDYLDQAVIDGLFAGDDQALGQLKNARSLFREYAQKFRENPGRRASGRESDQAGRFIEKIVAANPTGEEVVNAIFGAGNFTKGSGAALATRLRSIVGPDSEEWSAIRRAAFDRLVQTNTINGVEVISGQKTLSALDKATERNETLLRELFTESELGMIRRFAEAVQRTDPQIERSRLQPSGNIRALRQIAGRLGGAFGDASMLVISEGAERVSARRAASRARDAASRPFDRVGPARAGLTATGVGVSQSARGEESAPVPQPERNR